MTNRGLLFYINAYPSVLARSRSQGCLFDISLNCYDTDVRSGHIVITLKKEVSGEDPHWRRQECRSFQGPCNDISCDDEDKVQTAFYIRQDEPTTDDVKREQIEAARLMDASTCALMYAEEGNFDLVSMCATQIDSSVRRMCRLNNSLLLSTINTILVISRVRHEGSFPQSLIRIIYHATIEELGEGSSIGLLIDWMSEAAGGKLSHLRVESTALEKVCESISQTCGKAPGHSIVATYCLSFQLILEKAYWKAEEKLAHLYDMAIQELGPDDLQTISILATLSRAQSRQGKYHLALLNIERSLQRTPFVLGPSHPHRSELMLRKALICGKLGLMQEMQDLYWNIVKERTATLGAYHVSTQKAFDSLVCILQENGNWESHKDKAQRLLTEPRVAVVADGTSWQAMMFRMELAANARLASDKEAD